MLLVVAWSCLVACVALALDTALVLYQGRQLQTACESAALAGAVELFDPSALTPKGLSHWLSCGGAVAYSPRDQRVLHLAAFQSASEFASANRAGGVPVDLRLAADDAFPSDVVAGVVANPTAVACPLLSACDAPGLRCNSLLVRTSRATERGNPVTLWFGQLLGLDHMDLTAAARATLDQRVVGVRPTGHVRVPLVPIAITAGADGTNDWIRQATGPCRAGQNDQVAAHRMSEILTAGSDGVPEIELTLPLDENYRAACNACLVRFSSPEGNSYSELARQVNEGHHQADLAHCGGQLVLSDVLPVASAGATSASGIASAVESAIGSKRIWLLAESTGDNGCRITGFAAGQTIAVGSESGRLRISVQPCQLVTCTAMTGVSGPTNPWIGKLLRSE